MNKISDDLDEAEKLIGKARIKLHDALQQLYKEQKQAAKLVEKPHTCRNCGQNYPDRKDLDRNNYCGFCKGDALE